MISVLDPKRLFFLDTAASNVLTFNLVGNSLTLADTSPYVKPPGASEQFPFIASGTHTASNFLALSAQQSSFLPQNIDPITPINPLKQFFNFGNFLVL